MVRFKEIQESLLDSIKNRLGPQLVRTNEALDVARCEMHETLDIWQLGADRVIGPTNDLRRLATATSQFHHQIHFNDSPNIYIRSQSLGASTDKLRITDIFQSELAYELDAAISWVDVSTPDNDILVRLLIVPAFQIHTLWLIQDGREDETVNQTIVVVSAPDIYGFKLRNHKYQSSEFLSKLREADHVRGLTDR